MTVWSEASAKRSLCEHLHESNDKMAGLGSPVPVVAKTKRRRKEMTPPYKNVSVLFFRVKFLRSFLDLEKTSTIIFRLGFSIERKPAKQARGTHDDRAKYSGGVVFAHFADSVTSIFLYLFNQGIHSSSMRRSNTFFPCMPSIAT